jgi:cytochrome c5
MRLCVQNLWQVAGVSLLALNGPLDMAGDTTSPSSGMPAYPEYADARLSAGRAVWMGTCEGCHGYGIAGSPRIGDVEAWVPRIAQGKETLYAHALEGFFGKGSTYMPPRGGNDALSDDEVRSAVDYMVTASTAEAGGAAGGSKEGEAK